MSASKLICISSRCLAINASRDKSLNAVEIIHRFEVELASNDAAAGKAKADNGRTTKAISRYEKSGKERRRRESRESETVTNSLSRKSRVNSCGANVICHVAGQAIYYSELSRTPPLRYGPDVYSRWLSASLRRSLSQPSQTTS